jgi:hemerythrin
MQLSGFPPIQCHEREHANVIEVCVKVREQVAAGDHEIARTLATALAEWFAIHADTMDRALAAWLGQGAGTDGAPENPPG